MRLGKLRTVTLAATVAIAAGASTAASAEEWKIGVLFPLSGVLSVLGTEALAGDEVAVDMVNEKGGVNGNKVVLVTADATSPATATSEARRLVTRDGAKFLAGTYGSSIALAIAAVANQFKIPYWEGAAISDELNERGYPYVFRLNDNCDKMAAGLTQTVSEIFAPKIGKPLKDLKIAIIHEDGAAGTGIAKDFGAQMKEKGVTLAADEPYAANTQDLAPLVLRLKELNPDVVVASQYFNDAVLFWRQARNAGYNPKYFVAIGAGQSTPDYRKGVGDDADGVLIADVPSTGVKPDGLLPEVAEVQKEFLKRYKAKMGKEPASHATRNFSSMYVLLTKVLPKAGSLDPDKVKAAAMSLDEPVGSTILGFGIKFDASGQNTRSFNIVLQWQKGELVAVWPQRFATAAPIMVPLPDWSQRGK